MDRAPAKPTTSGYRLAPFRKRYTSRSCPTIVDGGTYFFTVNLLNRKQRLLIDHIEILRASFRSVRRDHPFHFDAIVILTEHLHCIWTLPDGDADCSTRWRLLKGEFSRAMPMNESKCSSSRAKHRERLIWQRRFWEHVIRDEADYARHVDYIHFNPVKHEMVARPIDWPYSSIHDFVSRGIITPDWGTNGGGEDLDLD